VSLRCRNISSALLTCGSKSNSSRRRLPNTKGGRVGPLICLDRPSGLSSNRVLISLRSNSWRRTTTNSLCAQWRCRPRAWAKVPTMPSRRSIRSATSATAPERSVPSSSRAEISRRICRNPFLCAKRLKTDHSRGILPRTLSLKTFCFRYGPRSKNCSR